MTFCLCLLPLRADPYDQENTINNDFLNSATSCQPGAQYQSQRGNISNLNPHPFWATSHTCEQSGHIVKRENEAGIKYSGGGGKGKRRGRGQSCDHVGFQGLKRKKKTKTKNQKKQNRRGASCAVWYYACDLSTQVFNIIFKYKANSRTVQAM